MGEVDKISAEVEKQPDCKKEKTMSKSYPIIALAISAAILIGCGGGGGGSSGGGKKNPQNITFDPQYGVDLALALTAEGKRLNIDSSNIKEAVALLYGSNDDGSFSALSAVSVSSNKFVPLIKSPRLKRGALGSRNPFVVLSAPAARDGDTVSCDISGYAKFFGDNASVGGFTYHDCSDDAGFYLNGLDKFQGNKLWFDNLLIDEDPYSRYNIRLSGFEQDDVFLSALPLSMSDRGSYGESDPDEEQVYGYNNATFSQIAIDKASGEEITFGFVDYYIYENFDDTIFIYRGLIGNESYAYYISKNIGGYDCDSYDDGIETSVGEHNISKSKDSAQKINIIFASKRVKVNYIDGGSVETKFDGTCAQFVYWLDN
jgi:hypothetical protein